MQTTSSGHDKKSMQPRKVEFLLIAGFWTLMALLQVIQRSVDPRGPFPMQVPIHLVALRSFAYFYAWALLTPLVFRLCTHVGFERGGVLRNAAIHSALAFAAALLMDVIDGSLRIALGFRHPGKIILLDFRLLNELIIYLAVLAAGFARTYFYRYRKRREETVRLQAQTSSLRAQLAEARLEALRSQLNPHFLFNTLNAISSLVESEPRSVRRMIARLGEMLRHTLDASGEAEVRLDKELGFLERYLEIEQIRFQGKLEVRRSIEAGLESALVPNLILQPLVENAIKHGVSRQEDAGRIAIEARRLGEQLLLCVRDNGPGYPDGQAPPPSGGLGLANIRARLRELYGNAAGLELQYTKQGTEARILLPFHTPNDLHTQVVDE